MHDCMQDHVEKEEDIPEVEVGAMTAVVVGLSVLLAVEAMLVVAFCVLSIFFVYELQSRKQKQEEETEKNQKKVKWESVTVMGNPCAFLFIL